MEQQKTVTQSRIIYFDYLRILATFAVIIIHVSAQNGAPVAPRTWEWQTLNLYNSCVRWPVPVFLMMSGALFLRSSYNIKKLLTKNVVRILTAYVFWSTFYALFCFVRGDYTLQITIGALLTGHYHLWFLIQIAVLYLSVPLLKPIAESEKATKYFFILVLIFSFILPQIRDLLNLAAPSTASKFLIQLIGLVPIPLSENVFYFLCGYYLQKTEISPQHRKYIFLLGILGLLFTITASAGISLWKNASFPYISLNYTLNVGSTAISLFVFAKYHLSFSGTYPKNHRMIERLSAYSFGVYLIHPFFIEVLDFYFHWNPLSFSPVISVPVISLVVAALSFSASALIHRIPIINKYIV